MDNQIIIKVDTYDDFIKYSNIQKIFIINKDLQKGYFKPIGECWYKLYHKDKVVPSFIGAKYTLRKLIYEYCNKLEYSNSDIYDVNNKFQCDPDKILNDIVDKCYTQDDIKLYNFKYYELSIVIDSYTKIINTRDNKLYDLNFYDSHLKKFRSRCEYYTPKNINVNIVTDILKYLLKDQNILTLYKKLCYSVFVEKNPESIIFNDYYDDQGLLTEWLEITSYLTGVKFINGNHYYNKFKHTPVISKKLFKYRFVILYQDETHNLLHLVKYFEDLGFINIIICYRTNSSQSIYNSLEDFKKYLINNTDTIRDSVNANFVDNVYIRHYDDIFAKSNLMRFNFLKWCCHK